MSRNDKIYSATYSNVPVYEYNVEGNHVMRRRSDDWINATHILKVADYDKPARTRILEREVQKGVHEKVQGGYGKYQGTWIPLAEGKELAAKNNVLDKLRPIFDFVPGDRSPPPAPKHATASSKPRARGSAPKRQPVYTQAQDYDQMDLSIHDAATPDRDAYSESAFDEYDYTNPRKRRRVEEQLSQADKEHQLWAEDLLDYFMLEDSLDKHVSAPKPPAGADLNRPVDDRGHTALHWAVAMGDLELVKDLVRDGAARDVQSFTLETPLMRVVPFTNNYDVRIMDKIAGYFIQTVNMQDRQGNSVFHHISHLTSRKSRYHHARYYLDCILDKMVETYSPDAIEDILNQQDVNGDTAILIAARNGARKCVRSLICRNASMSIPNDLGETAEQYIVELNNRRRERESHRQLSSSPIQGNSIGMGLAARASFQPEMNGANGHHDGLGFAQKLPNGIGTDLKDYRSEAAATMKTSVLPTVVDQINNLTNMFESELAEKDAELAEAERVEARRRAELESMKQQADECVAQDLEQTSEELDSDTKLDNELNALLAECDELTVIEQNKAFSELLEFEKTQLPSSPPLHAQDQNSDDTAKQKLDLARQLQSLMEERRELIRSMVRNLSLAGAGKNHAYYKRLITTALQLPGEDVEATLPIIAAELEESYGLESVGA